MNILKLLDNSKSQYHAVSQAAKIAEENGFVKLNENDLSSMKEGGKYFIIRDGSAFIAFTLGKNAADSYKIVAAHTDSPCFKVKLNAEGYVGKITKLNVEHYGGGLLYSWFDRPLKLAGRLCGVKDEKICSVLYTSEENFVIPSLAIHMNRKANDGFAPNKQVDMRPAYALSDSQENLFEKLEKAFGGKLLDYDLYLVCDQPAFYCGLDNKLICAPRVDNLSSCFAALTALTQSCPSEGTNVVFLADNEEVGSRTKQGAGSKFLYDTLESINAATGKNAQHFKGALASSFMVSCDNAHAMHPNHPELSDEKSNVTLGSGIVIKHHANNNYTTDAMSSAIFKDILNKAEVPFSDFFMRSDMPCGGTLGAISSAQLSIRSIDIGTPQLAMHSACETFAASDYDYMVKGLCAFYGSNIKFCDYDCVEITK